MLVLGCLLRQFDLITSIHQKQKGHPIWVALYCAARHRLFEKPVTIYGFHKERPWHSAGRPEDRWSGLEQDPP